MRDGPHLTVVKWIPWDESDEYPDNTLGGWGGWFGATPHHLTPEKEAELADDEDYSFKTDDLQHRWTDYVSQCLTSNNIAHAVALRKAILDGNVWEGGDWHQFHGVPIFSDGTAARFSYRAWGDFLAAVWSDNQDDNYCYVDFYMGPATKKPPEKCQNSHHVPDEEIGKPYVKAEKG